MWRPRDLKWMIYKVCDVGFARHIFDGQLCEESSLVVVEDEFRLWCDVDEVRTDVERWLEEVSVRFEVIIAAIFVAVAVGHTISYYIIIIVINIKILVQNNAQYHNHFIKDSSKLSPLSNLNSKYSLSLTLILNPCSSKKLLPMNLLTWLPSPLVSRLYVLLISLLRIVFRVISNIKRARPALAELDVGMWTLLVYVAIFSDSISLKSKLRGLKSLLANDSNVKGDLFRW